MFSTIACPVWRTSLICLPLALAGRVVPASPINIDTSGTGVSLETSGVVQTHGNARSDDLSTSQANDPRRASGIVWTIPQQVSSVHFQQKTDSPAAANFSI